MIYQLLKRDEVWRLVPYAVLGCAVVYPLIGASVGRAAFLSVLLGLGAAVAGFQRATRFQAGLPIAARQLFLTRLLSLLGILWLPPLAGVCMILATTGVAHAASALAVAKAVAVCTLAIAALQSIEVRELTLPRWLIFPVMFLFQAVGLSVTKFAGATPVLAVCLPLIAVLLLRTWRALPKSYQLAPAGNHPRTASASNAAQRAKTTGRFSPAAAWWPVLHSVFSWQHLIFLTMLLMVGTSKSWIGPAYCVGMLWLITRQQIRWLWSLPINARALLLTILAPILLTLTGGYFAGPHMAKRHIPVPDLNAQVLNLAATLGLALIIVLCMVLYDWRRLGRVPKWVRALPALLLVGIPSVLPAFLMLFAPSTLMKRLPQLILERPELISGAIPGGVLGALAASVAALTALYWAVEKVFSESEFAGKPRPPQDFEFLRR